jgi:hypothetical protein
MPSNGAHVLFRGRRRFDANNVDEYIVIANGAKYQVKRTGSGGSTSARNFDTRKEAEDFVRSVTSK